MMAFLWFKHDLSHWERKRSQLDIQQVLNVRPVRARGWHVRATLEISPGERPWNKAQAVSLEPIRNFAKLGRDVFDIRLVTTGIRIAVDGHPRTANCYGVTGLDYDRV